MATLGDDPLATTLEQAESEHTWKPTVPVSPASGSLKVAVSVDEFVRAPPAGVWSVGSLGKVDAAGWLICARPS